jgi:enamine deaminase RidA (YjgF/YER057c/UK114 family)
MPATRGYTHVVETRGPSRTIYLAGQLGMTPDGKFAGGAGDFRAQATQAFENVKLALAAVGAGFDHVVKVTAYFADMAHLQTYFEVRDRYVNTKAPRPRPRCRLQSSRATPPCSRSRRSRWCLISAGG